MQNDNIKIMADILKDGKIDAIRNEFIANEKRIKEFKAVLENKLAEIVAKAAEEARIAAEKAAQKAAEETLVKEAVKPPKAKETAGQSAEPVAEALPKRKSTPWSMPS